MPADQINPCGKPSHLTSVYQEGAQMPEARSQIVLRDHDSSRSFHSSVCRRAIHSHLLELSPHDRNRLMHDISPETLNGEALVQKFRDLQTAYESRHYYKCMEKLKPILTHVRSFGRIVDVAVQASPEIGCLVWSGIRLVLEVRRPRLSTDRSLDFCLRSFYTHLTF